MKSSQCLLAAALAAGLISVAAAAPYPRHTTPAAVDLGAASGVDNSQLTVTLALKLRNPDEMQALLQSLYTPGNTQYRHFLSSAEFARRFGPTDATVARLSQHFRAAGLSVARTATSQLKVTGSPAAIQSAFAVQLHTYEVAANGRTSGYRYRAPLSEPQLASDIDGSVQAVLGLDSRPRFRPHLRHSAAAHAGGGITLQSSGTTATTDSPGDWTVVDFAQYYNVEPLYRQGITGRKQTIGIITLAAFTPSDAFKYWKSLGLTTASNRITEIQIDGGSGAPSDDAGSDETTLDVEQSGGLAPAARLIVYEAPNTDQAFIDAYAAAVDSNAADTISTSWGQWEYLDVTDPKVKDPVTGRKTTSLTALADILVQAALQGQSMYAAAGDAGSYDSTDSFVPPDFNAVFSIDDPAAQPLMTAAGGTVLAGKQTFSVPGSKDFKVNIPTEEAWSWTYLLGLCKALGQDPITCQIFPAGGGGGVSIYFPRPPYQFGIAGMATTEPGQSLVDSSGKKPKVVVNLPADFPGRNIPDLSVNSDPDTGYTVFYTSDQDGFGVIDFYGGTSFASPQLNGVTALLNQALGGRVGLLNFPLYDLARRNLAYSGSNAPLRDIKKGDIWGYSAQPGYDQATGLGVPDVANLLQALQRYYY